MARRSGRPSVAVLSRDLIVSTALRLLDERGEQGASMREIARELGVRPSALYNHVSGYDDLIAGVRELISDRIDVTVFGRVPWDEALTHWAHSYRSAFAAHPPTIALLAVQPLSPGSRTGHMYEAVCVGLRDAGWPEQRILTLVVGLESFILGSALDQVAPDDILHPGDDPATPVFRAVHAARERLLRRGDRPADLAFESGLHAMLTGLKAEFAALESAPTSS